MELKATRSSVGDYGSVPKGKVLVIDDETAAKALLKSGAYIEYDKEAEEKAQQDRQTAALAQAESEAAFVSSAEQAAVDAANELARLQTENADLIEQNATKASAITDLRTQLDKSEEQLAKTETALSERDANIARLEDEVASLAKATDETQQDAEKTGAKKAAK